MEGIVYIETPEDLTTVISVLQNFNVKITVIPKLNAKGWVLSFSVKN